MLESLSVTEYLNLTNEIIHPLKDVAVEGEVSGFTIRQNKWVFFSIKDDESVLECFSLAFKMNIPIEDGMQVRVHGYPSIYKKSGRFRMTVERIEPVGEGALKKEYEKLKQKLEAEGLFDPARKRSIPQFPQTIGFIGSHDSAAFTDFIKILNNRWGGVEVQVYDVRVQGDGAPGDIVKAFEFFNTQKQKPDVLVLTRGGGSLEDLWGFNDERVARAVFGSSIPVICGVGHEKDESLADFCADVRASTPSNAAEIIVPDKTEFIRRLESSINYIESTIDNSITRHSHAIRSHLHTLESLITQPLSQIKYTSDQFISKIKTFERTCASTNDQLVGINRDLTNQINRHITSAKDQLIAQQKIITQLDPTRILARGYSITRDKDGKVIKKSTQLAKGDQINIQFSSGSTPAKTI